MQPRNSRSPVRRRTTVYELDGHDSQLPPISIVSAQAPRLASPILSSPFEVLISPSRLWASVSKAVNTTSPIYTRAPQLPAWTTDRLPDEIWGPSIDEKLKEQQFPPADGGVQAWLFLFGSFWIEALVWGFPFSFGVFQEYYATHKPFSKNFQSVPAVGTTCSGLMYMLSPLHTYLLSRYPTLQRLYPLAGLLILCLSLFVSSFANSVTALLATQGIFYAIGGSMTYCAMISALDTWFIRRKGLAFGIVLAGNGFAGVSISYLATAGFGGFGFKTTVRVWALLLLIILRPLIWWQRPRVPVGLSEKKTSASYSFQFLRSPYFYVPFTCTAIQGLGFFLPSIYLPTYARDVNDATIQVQNATLTALNGAAMLGCIIVGIVADSYPVTTMYGLTSGIAAFSVFALWGFATTPANLVVFAIMYGASAGSYSTAWTGSIVELKRSLKSRDEAAEVDAGFVYGLFLAARGLGNIVSGPMSAALLRDPGQSKEAVELVTEFGAYGTQYRSLVVLTGVTAVLGGTVFLTRTLTATWFGEEGTLGQYQKLPP